MAAKPSGNKSVLVIGLGRFGGSVAATLLTYQVLVRATPIGRWLNGRTYPTRQRRERPAATATAR